MDSRILIILASFVVITSSWTIPFYQPFRRYPLRVSRHAHRPQQLRKPIPGHLSDTSEERWQRPKREHDDDFYNHDEYDKDRKDHKYDFDDHKNDYKHNDRGVTGPIHTFVKTDKNANYKWGVRHHVGQKFSPQ